MQDLSLNSNFSVHLDDRNDLATVEGRDAFEQSVVVHLTDFMQERLIGLSSGNTLEQKIRLEVTRVAREHNMLTTIADITIAPKKNQPDTYTVDVMYESDAVFSTELST